MTTDLQVCGIFTKLLTKSFFAVYDGRQISLGMIYDRGPESFWHFLGPQTCEVLAFFATADLRVCGIFAILLT